MNQKTLRTSSFAVKKTNGVMIVCNLAVIGPSMLKHNGISFCINIGHKRKIVNRVQQNINEIISDIVRF